VKVNVASTPAFGGDTVTSSNVESRQQSTAPPILPLDTAGLEAVGSGVRPHSHGVSSQPWQRPSVQPTSVTVTAVPAASGAACSRQHDGSGAGLRRRKRGACCGHLGGGSGGGRKEARRVVQRDVGLGPAPPALGVKVNVASTPALPATRSPGSNVESHSSHGAANLATRYSGAGNGRIGVRLHSHGVTGRPGSAHRAAHKRHGDGGPCSQRAACSRQHDGSGCRAAQA